MGVVGAMGDGGRMRRNRWREGWDWRWVGRAVEVGVKKVLGLELFVDLCRASPISSYVSTSFPPLSR